jgi:hypothetical protein
VELASGHTAYKYRAPSLTLQGRQPGDTGSGSGAWLPREYDVCAAFQRPQACSSSVERPTSTGHAACGCSVDSLSAQCTKAYKYSVLSLKPRRTEAPGVQRLRACSYRVRRPVATMRDGQVPRTNGLPSLTSATRTRGPLAPRP